MYFATIKIVKKKKKEIKYRGDVTVEKSWKNYIKWKQPGTRGYVLYESLLQEMYK